MSKMTKRLVPRALQLLQSLVPGTRRRFWKTRATSAIDTFFERNLANWQPSWPCHLYCPTGVLVPLAICIGDNEV